MDISSGTDMVRIDPYTLLVRDPETTFFLQAGADMPEWGISKGDMLVADSGAEAPDGKKVIAELDCQLRLMQLSKRDGRAWLSAEGREMEITGRKHVHIRGVLMWVLREM